MSVFIAWSGCEDVQEWSCQDVEVSSMREILGVYMRICFNICLKSCLKNLFEHLSKRWAEGI